MKKLAFLFILIMVLSLGGAHAASPTNPYASIAHSPTYYAPEESDSGMAVTLTCEVEPAMGVDGEWTLTVTGGTAPYTFQYYILTSGGSTNTYRHWSESNTLTHSFTQPGTYTLLTNVQDSTGSIVSARAEITVSMPTIAAHASTSATVAEKVTQVVNQCFASVNAKDHFAVALWLHDWLIKNAYYDMTYSYYEADGVLLRGTGVCDSYAKAYVLLLQKAGIEVKRVTGYVDGINHAWVIAKIDGEWCHIDPTWDDPITGDPAVDSKPTSGHEIHVYFGLPDIMMRLDHVWSTATNCTSYAANYDIHNGTVVKSLHANNEAAVLAKEFEFDVSYIPTFDEIQAQLAATKTFPLRLSIEGCYLLETSGPYSLRGYSVNTHTAYLIAYVLGQRSWDVLGTTMRFDVSYNPSRNELVFDLSDDQPFALQAVKTQSNIVPLGKQVVYTLETTGNGTIEAIEYQVFDAKGNSLLRSTELTTSYAFTPTSAGTYVVRVSLKATHGDWVAMESEPLTVVAASLNNPLKKLAIYVDGKPLDYTGFAKFEGADFYFEKGVIRDDMDGLTMIDGVWYNMQDGRLNTGEGLVFFEGGTFAVKNGTIDESMDGLVPYNGEKFVFSHGQFQPDLCGAWPDHNSGEFVYIWYGQFYAITDLVSYDGQIFYFIDGKLALGYTGVVKDFNGTEFYIADGQFYPITDLVAYDGGIYYFIDGKLARHFTGTVRDFRGTEFYVVNGKVTEKPARSTVPAQSDETPAFELQPEPGSSFETAILKSASFSASVDGTVYYELASIAAGTYDLSLRTAATAKDTVTVSLFSAAQAPLWSGRTDEGELTATLELADGSYYIVITSEEPASVDFALTVHVEATEDLPEEPLEESPTEEPATELPDEPVEKPTTEPLEEEPTEEPAAETLEEPAEAPTDEAMDDPIDVPADEPISETETDSE